MRELYQLVACETGLVFEINEIPVQFVFTGEVTNDNHPDNFIGIVLTSITDINDNIYTGCYTLQDATCQEDFTEVAFEEFFSTVETVATCQECLPEVETPVVINTGKTIYPEFLMDNVDPQEAEYLFCEFAKAVYQKVLSLRYGISSCCPIDLLTIQNDLEILKMDMTRNCDLCIPPEEE